MQEKKLENFGYRPRTPEKQKEPPFPRTLTVTIKTIGNSENDFFYVFPCIVHNGIFLCLIAFACAHLASVNQALPCLEFFVQ